MAAENTNPTEAAAAATQAAADAATNSTKAAAREGERATRSAAKATKRAAKTARKPARKATRKTTRRAPAAASKAKATRNERNDQMNFNPTNMFAGFGAFPGAASFEKLFTETAERSEEVAKRSRKAVEEFADIYRGNIDAFVEAGRIASAGAQSISQSVVAKSRNNLEQAAENVRSFAEAKSPTELLQLQGDFARGAFDRFVEDSSALTESLVKLAGEAIQPLSNRASATVERFNEIAA